jgi:cystathionine beta-lyase
VLAQWLARQPFCAQVLHPAWPGSPGHEHWQKLCSVGGHGSTGLAAGLFSIVLRPDFTPDSIDAFLNGLQRFKLGYSWGGPVSLVVPYALGSMRTIASGHLQPGGLVRFSLGLESVDDLIADLAQSAQRHLI